MNKEWSQLNKQFQDNISKEITFKQGIEALLRLRQEMFEMVMQVKNVFPNDGYYQQPFINSKGYDSKTMAYSIYHISRIEDIVCHTLICNDEQIFYKNNYQALMNALVQTTGNELQKEKIAEFSKCLNIDALFAYFKDVYETSNKVIEGLNFSELKRKVNNKEELIKLNCVSSDEHAFWLVDYWCSKDVLGLLKMPFSRHWIMHIEAFLKIKNEIIKREKKKVKDNSAVCGFSCDHCFLTGWCGGCKSEYNCCSYAKLFKDKKCPNVTCCQGKGLDGCYECEKLEECEVGFYHNKADAISAKANALFIKKYGKKVHCKVLDKMHQKHEFKKMQEIVGNRSLNEALKLLESVNNGIED